MSLVPHKQQPHCIGETDYSKRPHVVFYNLNNAGASAIVPILVELLTEKFQYTALSGPVDSIEFENQFTEETPIFHWTHSPASVFEQYLCREDFRFICLYRDPRDVLVSHVKDLIHRELHDGHTEKQLYLDYISSEFGGMFHHADEWIHLDQPNIHTLSFEEMKRDIPASVHSVLQSLGLEIPEPELQEVCKHHSFEALTGRKCGEDGPMIRTSFMFRKGISGDWKNQFDDNVIKAFHEHFDCFLQRWGYTHMEAHPEVQIVSAPFPSGAEWLVNVLHELGLKSRINHRLDFARNTHQPSILLTRDGRDAVHSHYHQHHAESMSFKDYLLTPEEWPEHFPGLFKLPPAETWGLFNLYWLEMAKITRVQVIRYEDTQTHPVQVVQEVLQFLNVHRTPDAINDAISNFSIENSRPQAQINGSHAACFHGTANEALTQLGYEPAPTSQSDCQKHRILLSENDDKIRHAIKLGKLTIASQRLLEQAMRAEDENLRLSILAERTAADWTHRIFNNELCRSRAANITRHRFAQLLSQHAENTPVYDLLTQDISTGQTVISLGEYRGYQLAQVGELFYALSPALGEDFRLAHHPPEDIQKLAEQGMCVMVSFPFQNRLKPALDTLLNSALKNITQMANAGDRENAFEALKQCINLTGAKDSATLEIANIFLKPQKTQFYEDKYQRMTAL